MTGFVFTEDDLRYVLYGQVTGSPKQSRNNSDYTHLPVPRQVLVSPSAIPGSEYGVFATAVIKAGTEMGPFVGTIRHLEDLDHSSDNTKTWEVFDKEGHVLYYIDGGSRVPASWLTYVQCARYEHEQNLELAQVGLDIFYRATRDIAPEEELLVWYGPSRCLYMGIPCLEDNASTNVTKNVSPNDSSRHDVDDPDVSNGKLRCVLCRRGFNSRSNLRSHMRIHTLEKPFTCRFCSRRFSQSSTLRNHVRLHTGEKPYRCQICSSAYSQLAGLRAHQRSARHKPSATFREEV